MAGTTSLANASLMDLCAQRLPFPELLGVKVTGLNASPALSVPYESLPFAAWTKSSFSGLGYCNISVSYTHPGQDDHITTYVYLSSPSTWNGRLLASGGASWAARMGAPAVIAGLDAGFAVVETDGGVPEENPQTSAFWALSGNNTGNPDVERMNNFASRALHEMAVTGKNITASALGQAPTYSYFHGCSQGGRQGHMLARRYLDDFDGIAALAPGINWAHFLPSLLWTRQLM